jgi:Tol biopolymer transport system component
MSIVTPPRPSEPLDRAEREALVEALIEEARRRARRRRLIYGAVAALVALVGVAVFTFVDHRAQSQTASPSSAARSNASAGTTSAKIAFMTAPPTVRRGNAEIFRTELYVMNADGSGLRNLTRLAWNVGAPAWSPDGRLAFERRLDPTRFGGQCGTACNVDIYAMNADGSGQRNLTRNVASDGNPVWSPDGRRIAFVSYRHGPELSRKADVYVMNADGTGQRRLTTNPAGDVAPAWSPDGKTIAFQSYHGRHWDVHVMNADGTGNRNLTRNRAQDLSPAWSPDGQKIAFIRTGNTTERHDRAVELYVMNADGSGQRRLTRIAGQSAPPAWSPDGRKLVFVAQRGQFPQIAVMNADGSGLRTLTRRAQNVAPGWWPDGRTIAFISTRDGRPAIYVMNADGSGQRRLASGVRRLASFSLSPAPRN